MRARPRRSQESNLAGMELALGQLGKAGKGGQVIGDRGGRAAPDAANSRSGLALQGQAYQFGVLWKHWREVVREAAQVDGHHSLSFQRSMASSLRSAAPPSELRMVAHTETTSAFRSADRPQRPREQSVGFMFPFAQRLRCYFRRHTCEFTPEAACNSTMRYQPCLYVFRIPKGACSTRSSWQSDVIVSRD